MKYLNMKKKKKHWNENDWKRLWNHLTSIKDSKAFYSQQISLKIKATNQGFFYIVH